MQVGKTYIEQTAFYECQDGAAGVVRWGAYQTLSMLYCLFMCKLMGAQEVQDRLKDCKLPIYCLFRAPRTEKDEEEAELDTSDAKELSASGMRLITMSLGIMQSFNGIQRIPLEWPVTRREVVLGRYNI